MAFTQMIWNDNDKVGFGVKGKWVVAWFCPGGNTPEDSQQAFVDNVNDVCLFEGYDRCYNKMAL